MQDYIGGLAHVHTKLSNHPGHVESDQTITSFVEELVKHGLAGSPEAPLQYVMVNEHTSNPTKPHALGRLSLRARALLRSQWQRNVLGVPIFYGFEASLMTDGSTDLTQRLADNCELVIASRHSLPQRILRDPAALGRLFRQACADPRIDVIGHPARGIEDMAEFDWDKFFLAAAKTGTAVEVNLNIFPSNSNEPKRYEFWAKWLAALGRSNAQVFIGSDLHNKGQLRKFVEQWRGVDEPNRPNSLRDCVGALSAAGISPDRVVNAEYGRFTQWLSLDKADRARHHKN